MSLRRGKNELKKGNRRSKYLVKAFSEAGLSAGNTSNAVYASVTPPRSSGTETILISANWISRDGGLNLRGIATLLAMGDFLRGMFNHLPLPIIIEDEGKAKEEDKEEREDRKKKKLIMKRSKSLGI